MTDAPPVRRRLVGATLRRLREQAGYSLTDAAQLLGCDRSKISRVETGQRGIQPGELGELLTAYGVGEPRRAALLAVAGQARSSGWWRVPSPCDAGQDFAFADAAGVTVCSFDAQLVPELLQTADYARALAAASLIDESPGAQEQFVQARLGQQDALTRENDPQRLWAILGEAALRQTVGGQEIMRAQLRHLIELSGHTRNVDLQVLPFSAGAHAATGGSFTVLKLADLPGVGVVYLEGQTGCFCLEQHTDVARYTLVFEHLRAAALSPPATAQLLKEAAQLQTDAEQPGPRPADRRTPHAPPA